MYRLRTIPSQIDKLWQFLELSQVVLKSSLVQMLMIQAVVPLMESDIMVIASLGILYHFGIMFAGIASKTAESRGFRNRISTPERKVGEQ